MKYFSVRLTPGHPAIGDVAAETAAIFDRARESLERQGMSFGDVLHTRFFYSNHDDFAPMAAVRSVVYSEAFSDGGFPASSGLVAGAGEDGEQHLEIEFVAGAGKRTFDAIDDATSGVVKTSPYHHAVSAEGLLYVSGFLGSVGAPTEQQFDHAARNLCNALAGAKRSLADALSITVYINRVEDALTVAARLDALLAAGGGGAPVVSVLCVHELSFDGFRVAIEAVAGDGEQLRSALVRENQLGELGVVLPRHATAVAAGSWLFANGAGFGSSTDDVFAAALAEAFCGLDELAPTGWAILRATVWYSPVAARGEITALAARAFGPSGADVTRFALRAPSGTGAAVRIQLTARTS